MRADRRGFLLAFLSFRKKRSGPLFKILRKYCVLGNTKVLRLQYFVLAKHHKVFKTTIFLKTVVFYEYFKNTLLPNRPTVRKNDAWVQVIWVVRCSSTTHGRGALATVVHLLVRKVNFELNVTL
jgi:hypothetical protein